MRINNFRDYFIHDGMHFASVDVITGRFWKKKETKQIARELIEYWYFVDNGEFTPDSICERLERSYKAKMQYNAKCEKAK